MQDRTKRKKLPIQNPEDHLPAGDQYDPNSPASDHEEIQDPTRNKKIKDPQRGPKIQVPPDPKDKPKKIRR